MCEMDEVSGSRKSCCCSGDEIVDDVKVEFKRDLFIKVMFNVL